MVATKDEEEEAKVSDIESASATQHIVPHTWEYFD
jgi:hypothetical protein